MAFDTPKTGNAENKRRKLSSSDVTHISQTPESQFKTPGMPLKASPDQGLSTKKALLTTPKKSMDDIKHIPESEDYAKPNKPSLCLPENPAVGQKRKTISPCINITLISQSQESEIERLTPVRSPDGKKFRLTRSKADVTHITQTQGSQSEKRTRSTNAVDITHISQSQNSQDDIERCDVGKTTNQRCNLKSSWEEGNVVPVYQIPPGVVKIQETPSPEVNFTAKRRKIASPSLNLFSDNERSIIGETQRSPTSVSPPFAGQTTLDDSLSSLKKSPTSCSNDGNIVHSKVNETTPSGDNTNERESTKESGEKREINEKKLSETKSDR